MNYYEILYFSVLVIAISSFIGFQIVNLVDKKLNNITINLVSNTVEEKKPTQLIENFDHKILQESRQVDDKRYKVELLKGLEGETQNLENITSKNDMELLS